MRSVMLGAGLLAAAAAFQPAAAFGPEDVKRELVGKTWIVRLPNGSPATEYFNADGTVRITGGLMDQGRWRLWEQGYCTTWRKMRSGAERCFTLTKNAKGEIEIFKPDGEISMTIVGFK